MYERMHQMTYLHHINDTVLMSQLLDDCFKALPRPCIFPTMHRIPFLAIIGAKSPHMKSCKLFTDEGIFSYRRVESVNLTPLHVGSDCLFEPNVIVTTNGIDQAAGLVNTASLGFGSEVIHATNELWTVAERIESLFRIRTKPFLVEACCLWFEQVEEPFSGPTLLLGGLTRFATLVVPVV